MTVAVVAVLWRRFCKDLQKGSKGVSSKITTSGVARGRWSSQYWRGAHPFGAIPSERENILKIYKNIYINKKKNNNKKS